MIQKIEATLLGSTLEAGGTRLVSIRVKATFSDPSDVGTFSVVGARSVGCLYSPTQFGPFSGNLLGSVEWPAPDGQLEATRRIWVMAGWAGGTEVVRVVSDDVPTLRADVEIPVVPLSPRSHGRLEGDPLFASSSSFLDMFEDREVLRGFWDGMAKAASDVDASVSTIEKSYKVFQIPAFTVKTWEMLKLSDATGGFDGGWVKFRVPASRDYTGEISYNVSDRFDSIQSSPPDAFLLMSGTVGCDAVDAAQMEDLDGTSFLRSSSVNGSRVVVQSIYRLNQAPSSVVSARIWVDARSWGTARLLSGATVDAWDWENSEWVKIGTTGDEWSSDPGAPVDLVSIHFGSDVRRFISPAGIIASRVVTSVSSDGSETISLSIDRVGLSVGTDGFAAVPMRSPQDTPPSRSDMAIRIWPSNSDDPLVEGVDYYLDFEGARIVYLGTYESEVSVLVCYDHRYPYSYSVQRDLVAIPELRSEVLSIPAIKLRDGRDFVLRRLGRIKFKNRRHGMKEARPWWAPASLRDDKLVFRNFGWVTQRLDDETSSMKYLRRIQGLWYAFWSGPSIQNIESGISILLDAPFAHEQGVVTSVVGNELRLSTGQSATKPDGTPWAVSVGEKVDRYQALTAAGKVVDRIVDPSMINSLSVASLMADMTVDESFVDAAPRLSMEPHVFTVEVDAKVMAALGGASSALLRQFIMAIKPVHTFVSLGVVLQPDCGELTWGPCGLESGGNCLCSFTPPPYDIEPEVGSYVDMDLSELMQRHPYVNDVVGEVADQAALQAVASPDPGDTYWVLDEKAWYVWYEPQKLPQPNIDLGRYIDGGTWYPRIPNQQAARPMQTWHYKPEAEVAADEHSAGNPPEDQWQWGGSWVKVVHPPFDLPQRTIYKTDMDLHDSPSSGGSDHRFYGTAREINDDDVPSYSGATHSLGPIIIPANGRIVLPNTPVTKVKRVANSSRGISVPGSHYKHALLTGVVTFDSLFSGQTWAPGDIVTITYRQGFIIDDRITGEAGHVAAKSYSDRGELEEPSVVGEPYRQFDEAYDRGGDFPGVVVHGVAVAKNGLVNPGNGVDEGPYTVIYGNEHFRANWPTSP